MSYSRWLTSYWYTFWLATTDETTEDKDSAKFCICNLAGDDLIFTAKELREERSDCIKYVREQDPHASNSQIKELNIYMDNFIEDVDETYTHYE